MIASNEVDKINDFLPKQFWKLLNLYDLEKGLVCCLEILALCHSASMAPRGVGERNVGQVA